MRALRVMLMIAAFASACGSGRPPEDATRAALRTPIAAAADPTLHPARLVPVHPGDDDKTFGVEAGGGKRMLVGGVRVVRLAGGGITSAVDPLPAPPSATIDVPDRLGGGFLFAIGSTIWRADQWLSPLSAIYKTPGDIAPTHVFVGLDRAYVRLANGAYAGFDAKLGTPMDLGPWPGSPEVTRYVAADGWRAVAIADLRGVVATFDAGGKWQTLPLPIQPKELRLAGDAIVVSGADAAGETQSYAVQPSGQIAHLQEGEARVVTNKRPTKAEEDLARANVKNPLLGAVLDGWPLEGGTALVARDGALTRVRMSDGAVMDTAPDAFPLKPSHCHAISLAPPKAPAAFGFVCGMPHGTTEIYAYDPRGGKLTLLRHFDAPRAVFSPANGTLVIEGACDADANAVDVKKTEQAYCIMRKNGLFEDFVVNGDVGTERVVALADGRTAIVSPPVGDLATARLTIFDGTKPKTIPIVFSNAPVAKPRAHPKRYEDDDEDDTDNRPPEDDATITTAMLRSGTWLRGLEERTPNVLSAWVEHSTRYIGVEISLDGTAKHGPYVAELGTAVVSGRYALGWSASRQGYETIDGGMTWKPLALPEPLESAGPAAGATSHGCGPLGCVLAGWIRVGWGAPDDAASASPATVQSVDLPYAKSLSLRCEIVGKPALASLDTTNGGQYGEYNRYGYGRYSRYGGYYGGRYGGVPTTQDWQPFFTLEAPKLVTDDLGFSMRTDEIFDHGGSDRSNSGQHYVVSPLARLYAWGQKGIDWDLHARYMVRFTSPWESSSILHVTQTTPVPHYITDATNFVSAGAVPHVIQSMSVITGDDSEHALLVLRRYGGSGGQENVLVDVEAERPAIEVHRGDGQPLGDIESAVRMSGRWYLATTEPLATAIWEVESGSAREVTRVPRASADNSHTPIRLAKRADGHMLGAIVEGTYAMDGAAKPSGSNWFYPLWVLPIDVDSGVMHEPERLGYANASGKRISVCGPEDGGWIVDGKWPGGNLNVSTATGATLHSGGTGMLARYRLTPTSLCLEKLSLSGYGDATTTSGSLGKNVEGPFVTAGVLSDRARQSFRCITNK